MEMEVTWDFSEMHFRTEIRGKRRTKILSKGGIETKLVRVARNMTPLFL